MGRSARRRTDLEDLTLPQFHTPLARCRAILTDQQARPLGWRATTDLDSPGASDWLDPPALLRLNDHRAEPLPSVITAGQVIGDLVEWPPARSRPPQTDPP